MLRIHTQREAESTSLAIEGKLAGPWVMELEKCWREETNSSPTNRVVVNLAAVSFVDADGRELLSRMRRQGTRLVARGCLMKTLVEAIEAGLSEGSTPDAVAKGGQPSDRRQVLADPARGPRALPGKEMKS